MGLPPCGGSATMNGGLPLMGAPLGAVAWLMTPTRAGVAEGGGSSGWAGIALLDRAAPLVRLQHCCCCCGVAAEMFILFFSRAGEERLISHFQGFRLLLGYRYVRPCVRE